MRVELGTGVLLFVFHATGDWFLLRISLFFLAGVASVVVKTLPRYVEQIRWVLNVGAVNEEEGDWVSLDDGTIGCVDYQTPSVVQLALLGGSREVYSTPSFLEHNPQNMSTNYRVEFTFGIDYKHQGDCTVKIPEKMRAILEAGLPEVLNEEELLHVDVERAASRLLIDACNENGWETPFQQLRVHQVTS